MNKKITVLIGGIGGNVASAAARVLKTSYENMVIIGVDTDHYSYGKMYADYFYVSPPYLEKGRYIDFVVNMCRKHRVNCYLPVSEDEISVADEYREVFIENGINMLINSHEILTIGLSKYKTHKFLKEIGIDTPDTFIRGEKEPETYPIIVKNDRGNGSHGIQVVVSKEEYDVLPDGVGVQVVQQYIGTEDAEYTVPIFSDGQRVLAYPMKRRLGLDGMSVHTQYVNSPELEHMALRIAHALKLVGCIDFQCRENNGKYVIFEINPRISSSVGFRNLAGFSDLWWWVQCLELSGIPNYEFDKREYVGKKVLSEVIFNEEGEIIGKY